ncbi:hypothetical protein BGZ54_003732, partial [Gamsiella multidivaricata]
MADIDAPAPLVSPISSVSNSTAGSSPQPNHIPSSEEADMMASLDEVLKRKVANEVSSDYYSSSAAGGSDNGQDEDSDVALHSGTHHHHHPHQGEQISVLSSISDTQIPQHPHPQPHAHDDGHFGSASQDGEHEHEHEQQEEEGPSPDQMGLDNLGTMDLRMLLQHAYEVIQEKDRDLGMAAVMGQDLIDSNTNLQAKYQHILTQLRHQRMHRPRQLTPPRKIILSPAPEMSGSIAIIDPDDNDGNNSGDENWVDDFEPSRSSSSSLHPISPPTSSNSHHHATSFRRSPTSHNSNMMRSRSRQDIEKLASLEELNAQLQGKVDAVTKELKHGRRQAFKRLRRAEKELKMCKDELDRTTFKVVDLEEQNGRLIEASRMIRMRRIMLKNQLPAPGSIPGSTMANMALEMIGDDVMDEITIQEMLAEDNRIFEELRDRLQSLERKNTALMQQKAEADRRTQQLAQDLSDMQQEQEELMANLCGLSDLQSAYDEQSAHVRELENSIEELQNTISTMSSRFSQMNSPLLSPADPSSPVQSVWRREDADFKALKTILHGASPQPMALKSPGLKGQRRPRRTLLAELESEWFRDVSFFGPPRVPEQQQQQQQQPIHLGGPKSPKALKNHRHDSESDAFSDDAGGRVNGWRERIQDMGEESMCESSSCIRKRRNRFKYAGSDTDGGLGEPLGDSTAEHGDDSDVERYQLRPRKRLGHHHQLTIAGGIVSSGCEDESADEDMSDCSDPHHLHYRRPSTPGCCCH